MIWKWNQTTPKPPEDIGGAVGFQEFVQSMADPEDDDHFENGNWHGGPYDPKGFDVNTTNARIRRLRRRAWNCRYTATFLVANPNVALSSTAHPRAVWQRLCLGPEEPFLQHLP